MDNFQGIADFQDWSLRKQRQVLLDFIEQNRFDKALVMFANNLADEENDVG